MAIFKTKESRRRLNIGQHVDLHIALPIVQDVFPIPVEALYNGRRIYAVREGRLRPIELERVGKQIIDNQERILVRSKMINEGEYVIASKLSRAIDGQLVEIRNL